MLRPVNQLRQTLLPLAASALNVCASLPPVGSVGVVTVLNDAGVSHSGRVDVFRGWSLHLVNELISARFDVERSGSSLILIDAPPLYLVEEGS